MKKIFILAAAALGMLAACTEIERVEEAGPQEIVFGSYSARATKATIVDADELMKTGFYVCSVYQNIVYFNTLVNYQGFIQNRYLTNGISYYWPADLSTNKISFYAANFDGFTYASNNVSIVDYTNPLSSADQLDLVVAQIEGVSSVPTSSTANDGYQYGVQDLVFDHALTKINFTIASASDELTYNITSLKVKALQKGTYKFGTDSDAGMSVASDTDQEFIYYLGDSGIAVSSTDWEGDKNLMLIPQNGTMKTGEAVSHVDCEIEYTVTKTVSGVTVPIADYTGTNKKEFRIPTEVTGQKWASGKSFCYTLKLGVGVTPIMFAATVTDWETPEHTTDISI